MHGSVDDFAPLLRKWSLQEHGHLEHPLHVNRGHRGRLAIRRCSSRLLALWPSGTADARGLGAANGISAEASGAAFFAFFTEVEDLRVKTP